MKEVGIRNQKYFLFLIAFMVNQIEMTKKEEGHQLPEEQRFRAEPLPDGFSLVEYLPDEKEHDSRHEPKGTVNDEKIFLRELGRMRLSLGSMNQGSGVRLVMTHFPPTDTYNSVASVKEVRITESLTARL
jgi:hypothetical protein